MRRKILAPHLRSLFASSIRNNVSAKIHIAKYPGVYVYHKRRIFGFGKYTERPRHGRGTYKPRLRRLRGSYQGTRAQAFAIANKSFHELTGIKNAKQPFRPSYLHPNRAYHSIKEIHPKGSIHPKGPIHPKTIGHSSNRRRK